jgi:CRISPR-associated protein Csm5
MKYLENNPDEMDRFFKGNFKLNQLKKRPEGKSYSINIGKTSEINEFIKNGNGNPYIPGSSLKGALRTVILKKKFDDLSTNEKSDLLKKVNNPKQWASEPVEKKLLGPNSNENLMRIVEIFDAEFNELNLDKVLIISLTDKNYQSYGWKKLWSKHNTNDFKNALQIIVETLPIGSKGYFSLHLNNFLINDDTAKNMLNFKETSFNKIQNLITVINKYSQQKLENERTFFENLKRPEPLTLVIKEIDNLLNKIKNLSENEFIFRISWGGGWKGMTGDFLDENWLSKFKEKYRLGLQNFPFPKTRRIVFDNDKPKYLTGWIKIKLHDKKTETQDIIDTSSYHVDPMILLKEKFNVKETKNK